MRVGLAVADGAGTTDLARVVWASRPTVIKWRDRFCEPGIAGLDVAAAPAGLLTPGPRAGEGIVGVPTAHPHLVGRGGYQLTGGLSR